MAGRFVLPVAVGERAAAWCVVDRDQVEVKALAPFDATRGLAELQLDDVEVGAGRWLAVPPRAEAGAPEPEGRAGPADPAELATLLAGAEALGVAEWCVRTAADHAAVRVQFGRPIGQFQAVKHRCADMFVRLETARAAVWDALRCADAGEPGWQVAYGAAAALAPDAAFRGAEDCIQVLGGIGYMWEHDAHIFLKRATATRHLLPAPPAARRDVAAAVAAGERRPHLQIGGWVLPTLIEHGSADQQERFVGPSLRGEIAWCQMFSEPGAGSDLASLTTRAERVDGGWSITGQKVWTTLADEADWGICLARTDPDAPPHRGIGCFLVDMRSRGIEVRPLRELTGTAMFNEVFLTDVVVPDGCVVGSPTAGWACARTTLANERVSMASGSSFGPGVAALFDLAGTEGVTDDPLVRDLLGRLVVDAHAVAALGLRTTLRAVGGAQPGPEASVRKLAAAEHDQAVPDG